jgi:hypothetical protein
MTRRCGIDMMISGLIAEIRALDRSGAAANEDFTNGGSRLIDVPNRKAGCSAGFRSMSQVTRGDVD